MVLVEVRVLELQLREVQLLDERLDLADELIHAAGAQFVEVAHRRRQQHRARDRGGRLGLDVDRSSRTAR